MTKRSKAVLIGIAFLASAALAQDARKPPWLWTPEERFRERFDAKSKQDRMARQRSANTIRQVKDGFWPIDGDANPELFLPSELMNVFLSQQIAAREIYRQAIKTAGWDYDDFWRVMESNAADFLAASKQMGDLQRKSHGHGPEQPDWDRLGEQLCSARTRALAAGRQTFGAEAFDKFLYTAVAPHLVQWASDETDNATNLTRMEKGCM